MPLSLSPVSKSARGTTLRKLKKQQGLAPAPADLSTSKVTISDVARAAGVSTTAVSYAINGKGRLPEATRQAVLEIAERLGYEGNYYAQRIKGGCSSTVAFVSTDLSSASGEKLILIQPQIIERGFSAPLHGLGFLTERQRSDAIKQLRRQRPRAIVGAGGLPEADLNELRRYREEGGILVCYDQTYPADFEQVNLDRELSGYSATLYLIEQGHRDIGISIHARSHAEIEPFKGFKRALKESEITFHEEWNCPGYPFESAGQSLAAQFLGMRKRPTAFYILDDRVASAFVHYILRSGLRVPQDISVITHDSNRVAEHCLVPLTVISHPFARIAASVVHMVLSRTEEQFNGPPRHVVIHGQLIERQSVQQLPV